MSWKFMKNCRPQDNPDCKDLETFMWNGQPIHYRPCSSDASHIYNILLVKGHKGRKGEYYIPKEIDPKVIVDIGANIGIASIYYATIFPSAKIYAFEPEPNNFKLLQKNIAGYANIKPYCIALGKENKETTIYNPCSSKNEFSTFSIVDDPAERESKSGITVTLRKTSEILDEIGARGIDLIKIDTEGSEYDILTSFDEEVLRSVRWIIGELHGARDYELLSYLEQWFALGYKRRIGRVHFPFYACNRNALHSLRTYRMV